MQVAQDRDALREHSRRTRDAELRFTAWHCGVLEAGHRRGERNRAPAAACTSSPTPTSSSPRRRHVPRSARFARSGGRLRGHRARAQVSDGAGAAHGPRRALRAPLGAARALQLGIVSQVVDPPERLRDEAQALAEKIANSPAAMAATKRALGRSSRAHRRLQAGQELISMWGTPTRKRDHSQEREAEWQIGTARDRPSLRPPPRRAARTVGWLINNRPDALNAMNAHMRDEFADAWLELDRDPAVRVIVHTGEGRAFQTGVDVAEIAVRRRRDAAVPAVASRTSTCTSPPGTSTCGSRSSPR